MHARTPAAALAGLLVLAACSAPDDADGPAGSPSPTAAAPSPSADPTASADPSAEPAGPAVEGPELPEATAEPQDVLTGLAAPWDVAFLPGGAVLVTQRDAAQVLLATDEGTAALTGPGAEALAAGTDAQGEGGLLGVAVSPGFAEDGLVHLYRTTASGNEVVRAELDPVARTLGELQPVLAGIPASGNHNGGRIAFGPDGMLYVATGDASQPGLAQDPGSLAGKILRVTPGGDPAPGNPTEGSPVWSLGHRNVQGLAWDGDQLVASEFGQNTWDELNVVEPGGNHGWPQVEGQGGGDGLVDPLVVWRPAEASPSGVAVVDGRAYVAGLRGQRLWRVDLATGEAAVVLEGLGRLRHVEVGPDGALWVLTNNTDGRGDPRDGDDRLVRLLPP